MASLSMNEFINLFSEGLNKKRKIEKSNISEQEFLE
jgi:hypothetical protein